MFGRKKTFEDFAYGIKEGNKISVGAYFDLEKMYTVGDGDQTMYEVKVYGEAKEFDTKKNSFVKNFKQTVWAGKAVGDSGLDSAFYTDHSWLSKVDLLDSGFSADLRGAVESNWKKKLKDIGIETI